MHCSVLLAGLVGSAVEGWGGDVDVDERDERWRGNESEGEGEIEEGVMRARGRESGG